MEEIIGKSNIYQDNDDKLLRIKTLRYDTQLIIKKYTENNNNNIINFKQNKLEKKIHYYENLKNDLIKLKKKMKVSDDTKALTKVQDKLDKLKIIIEIDKYKKEYIKRKNKYFYLNKYIYINGKRRKQYNKVDNENLPDNNTTIEFWNGVYNSNKDLILEENIFEEVFNKYENKIRYEDDDEITEKEVERAIKNISN